MHKKECFKIQNTPFILPSTVNTLASDCLLRSSSEIIDTTALCIDSPSLSIIKTTVKDRISASLSVLISLPPHNKFSRLYYVFLGSLWSC